MSEDVCNGSHAPSPAAAITRPPAPSLRIAYLDAAEAGDARRRNSVDILVPTEAAHLAATYCIGQGRDRTMFVRAPLVSIVPPELPHSLADRLGANTLILSIAAPFFDQVARTFGNEDTALAEPHAAADPLIREVGNAVERDLRARHVPDAHYVESLAMVLAAHVARTYGVSRRTKTEPCGGLAPHKLRCAFLHIETHLGEPLRVEELAEAVQLSPFHFARMFKRSTGHPPHLYVLMRRIARAKELLAGTDAALVDVAADVGFRTQGHFTGVFHRYAGFTPRAFRLHAREMADCEAPMACTRAGFEQAVDCAGGLPPIAERPDDGSR